MSAKGVLGAVLLMLLTATAQATPGDQLSEGVTSALATAQAAWAKNLLGWEDHGDPYDEQIFTELSPILDGLESIKLPEDQLLTD